MSVPPPPLPPIVVVAEGANQPTRIPEIVTLEAGEARCEGQVVTPLRVETPFPMTLNRYTGLGPQPVPTPYQLTFKISADGRPRDIRVGNSSPYPSYDPNRDQAAAALAASQFPPQAREGCSFSYQRKSVPIGIAPLPLVYAAASMARRGEAERELFRRARPADSNCASGPGAPLRLEYPDFRRISQAPGTRAWTFLGFDVDRRGHPSNVRLLGSSGNVALDRAGLRAVSGHRYTAASGYRGCIFYFYRDGEPASPLDFPPDTPPETKGVAACEIDLKTIAGLADGAAFPAVFRERKIEGVAALAYDTAPWGAIGNIRVLVSEPAEAFGEAARTALANAKVKESPVGYRGCVSRFRFKLPPNPEAEALNPRRAVPRRH